MLTNIKKMAASIVCLSALTLGGNAQACEYVWKTVYRTYQVPYDVNVVRYDSCGRPYLATLTRIKTVNIPQHILVAVR